MKVKQIGNQSEPKKVQEIPRIKVKRVGNITNNVETEKQLIYPIRKQFESETQDKSSRNKIIITTGIGIIIITIVLYLFVFNKNTNIEIKRNTNSTNKETIVSNLSPNPQNTYVITKNNDSLTYEMKLIKKKKCYGDTNNCSEADFTSVFIINGKNEEQLNKFINEKNLQFMNELERKKYVSVEGGLQDFVNTHSVNNYALSCHTQYYDTLEMLNEFIFCLNMWNDVETGNHPYTTCKRIYFKIEYMEQLRVRDIFISGFEKKLNAILFKKFKDNPHSAEANHIFTNFKLTFTNNFTLTYDSIIFNYNEGDIASIASGPIDIAIGFNEILDIININYLNELGYYFDESIVKKNNSENNISTQNKRKQNSETAPKYDKQSSNSNFNQPNPTKPKTTIR